MNRKTIQIMNLVMFMVIIFPFMGIGVKDSQGGEASLAKATFYVYWYDVGKSALEGLKGVKKVENGWHNLKEINRVYYDPAAVTIGEMEAALKRAKTYQGTVGVGDKWRLENDSALQPYWNLNRISFRCILYYVADDQSNALQFH